MTESLRGSKAGMSASCLQGFSRIATPNISDAMERSGGMHPEIGPMFSGAKVCGPAFTVKNYAKDNLMSHYALRDCRPGDVIVVGETCGGAGSGWGELMSLAARAKGVAGVVIDGTVRDVIDLGKIKFPVFARGAQPQGTVKNTPGQINCPVVCGGVVVAPGDLIVGDEDGVVVVPADIAARVLESARAIQQKEEMVRDRLAKGEILFDILQIGGASG